MAVTLKDIAKVCNVSYSTVSRALNGKKARPSRKLDEIRETARALGYKPNSLAVQLVTRKTNKIGLLIPDIANPHYSEIAKSVEDAAFVNGYQMFLCNSDWDVRKEVLYRDALLDSRVAGIIAMPVCDESHVLFHGLDTPVVLLGSRTKENDLSTVVMDNFKAAFQITEELIRSGHDRLAYIGRKVKNYTSADREDGFYAAVRANSDAVRSAEAVVSTSYQLAGGYRAAMELLRRDVKPNGIIAFNDFIALGAIQAVEELGLRPGVDVEIIGFDDIQFSSLPKINLTTITPSNTELGRLAIETVIHASESQEKYCRNILLEPHIIYRSTYQHEEAENAENGLETRNK